MHDPAAPAEDAPQDPHIQFDDFTKVDLRVATIKEAGDHPNADKLLLLKLDDGTPEGRQICAGIKGHYDPEQLVGRQIIVVANLAPRKMRGEISQGMLLAASNDDHTQVVLLSPMSEIAPGSRVG
ncbi:MAG: methionine--tRNA ligase subunit beta [Planctomycetota bacterium]